MYVIFNMDFVLTMEVYVETLFSGSVILHSLCILYLALNKLKDYDNYIEKGGAE